MLIFDFVLEIVRALFYVIALNSLTDSIMRVVLVIGIFYLFLSIAYVFISFLYILVPHDSKTQSKLNKYFNTLDKYKFVYYSLLVLRVVFVLAFAYKGYIAIALMLMFEELLTWLGRGILRLFSKK